MDQLLHLVPGIRKMRGSKGGGTRTHLRLLHQFQSHKACSFVLKSGWGWTLLYVCACALCNAVTLRVRTCLFVWPNHLGSHGWIFGVYLWNWERQVGFLPSIILPYVSYSLAVFLTNAHQLAFFRVNCSFYFKIGACRHGDRCSRLHNKPTFSQVTTGGCDVKIMVLYCCLFHSSDYFAPEHVPESQQSDSEPRSPALWGTHVPLTNFLYTLLLRQSLWYFPLSFLFR